MENVKRMNEDWRTALRNLDVLPDGSSPLSADSWERFEKRLRNPPKQRRPVNWMAAASLAVLMFISLPGTDESGSTMTIASRKDSGETMMTPKVVTSVPAKQSRQNKTAANLTRKSLPVVPIVDTAVQIARIIPQQVMPEEDSSVTSDQPIITATKAPMGVKHMNSLTRTVETSPGVTIKVDAMRRFHIRPEQNALVQPAPAGPAAEHTLKRATDSNN